MDDKEVKKSLSVLGSDDAINDIEEIRNSVRKSTPSIGLIYDKGVVLVSKSWKTENRLLDKEEIPITRQITENVAATFAGRTADGRQIISKLRESIVDDYKEFGQVTDMDYHIEKISNEIVNVNRDVITRPYGVELLVGGVDQRSEPKLYNIEPDGTVLSWYAYAVGRGHLRKQDYLEEEYEKGLTLDETMDLVGNCFQMKDNEKAEDFDGCYVDRDGYTKMSSEYLAKYLIGGDKQ